jgi:hypothetical protein
MLGRAGLAVALIGIGVALGGCGSTVRPTAAIAHTPTAAIAHTVTRASTSSLAANLAQAQRTHEYPGPPQHQTVVGGWRSAVQAVEVFTTTYINWTAGTVSGRLQALADVSVGQARSAMSLAASQSGRDYELQRGGIANSGVVEAIAPVFDHRDEYAVVTREQTTATNTNAYQGLAPAWHLTLATVTKRNRGLWVLSAWQPEN